MSDDEIIAALRARVADSRPTDLSNYSPRLDHATADDVEAAEQVIGYPLPPLLRRIYLEVANGGIGPFGGIDGLPTLADTSYVSTLNAYEDWYAVDLEPDEPPPLPRGVMVLCDFGCAMAAMIDFRTPDGAM
jgi:hypothetical protein